MFNRFKYFIFVLVIIISILFGKFYADIANKKYILGESRLRLLFSVPAMDLITLNKSLYSFDIFKRASAYYSLVDFNLIDIPFLEERFKVEKSLYIKKIIVWVIAHSENKSVAAKSLERILYKSEKDLKYYILSNINQVDKELLKSIINSSKLYKKIFMKKKKEIFFNTNFQI